MPNSMKWKDTTTYAQGESPRVPGVFTLNCPCFKALVTNRHVDYPGQWVFRSTELGYKEATPIPGVSTESEAKAWVKAKVQEWAKWVQFYAAEIE